MPVAVGPGIVGGGYAGRWVLLATGSSATGRPIDGQDVHLSCGI
jgi:hypothetical protein